MSWQILIGLSVLLYSVNSLLHRVLMKDDDSDGYTQATVFTVLIGIVSLVILILRGGFRSYLDWHTLPLFSLLIFLNALGMVFTFKSIKLIDASEHTILLTSSRLWVIVGAIFLLRESPTMQKLIGAGLVLLGVVISQWKRGKFTINIGSFYVLIAASFFAFGEIISFYILRSFDVFSFMVYASFATAITLVIAKPRVIQRLSFYFKPKRAINIIITSTNDALANLFAFTAYQVGRNALQIGPLGATTTIVTVVFALLILKENENMIQKVIGATTAVAGTMLLL